VYHARDGEYAMRGVPFLPRFDDALVAEFAESDAFSLEGRDRRFGGTHLGFDRRNGHRGED
ncbi:unnamed protein product, partial [Effrenium voratum]